MSWTSSAWQSLSLCGGVGKTPLVGQDQPGLRRSSTPGRPGSLLPFVAAQDHSGSGGVFMISGVSLLVLMAFGKFEPEVHRHLGLRRQCAQVTPRQQA